jgi:transcriptional regulator with XRE-family HTH domain
MARKKNGAGNRGYLGIYRTYNFINKDPAIDALRTIINDEGVSEAKLHVLSGVSVTTFTGWFRGDTKRPQHATLAAAASALGYDYELRKKKTVDIASELLKGQAWLDKQKERKAKG